MSIRERFQGIADMLGVEHISTSHGEKCIASIGALFAILAVIWISMLATSGMTAGLTIASMGASAVLLFVVPHGALSQPWPVAGGHVVSALIGVSCHLVLPDRLWSPAIAVSLAILCMQYLRCVHPPGGATALTAALGGPDIDALGYAFVLSPVLLNVGSIMLLALVFNNLFAWRRYPAALMKKQYETTTPAHPHQPYLTQEDFEAAMQKMNTFIDVTTDDLVELVDLATIHAEEQRAHPARLEAGHSYSNGRLGRYWSVRQILDASVGVQNRRDKVIYKVMAGDGAWDTGICGYEEFRQWAKFEVELKDGRWIRTKETAG